MLHDDIDMKRSYKEGRFRGYIYGGICMFILLMIVGIYIG